MTNLKALRKAAGLTQIRLARKAGVSRHRLCLAEIGELELRPDELAALNGAITTGIQQANRLAIELQNELRASG